MGGLVIQITDVIAQEAPSNGLVYNTTEAHSLTFDCKRSHSDKLECNFVQTAVRYKATRSDLPSALEKARKSFESEKPPAESDCETFSNILDIVEGKKPPPAQSAMPEMTAIQKADVVGLSKAYVAYCRKPDVEAFLEVARKIAEKEHRTCRVTSKAFSQAFRPAPAGSPTASVWIAEDRPEGECGLVQLSRFEPEVITIGKINLVKWKYVARKAVSNPNGELFPGVKCSALDEASYVYDWRLSEKPMSCDYIEFSPL
jgi:hypothetical protein